MAEQSENLKLIISGDGRLLRTELAREEREIRSWGGRVGRSIGRLRSSINSGLKRALINPITGIASVAGITALGAKIVDFDAKLMRLGIQGNVSSEGMVRMRKEILETAYATGQSRENILAGIDAIVERTGDIKFADTIKEQMGIAATASGAAMEDIGALSSNLNQKMKIDASKIMEALNILTVQGKAGAFTLSNQAALGERLFSSAGRLNMKGLDDLKRFGALMQVARMGTGSAEQATTAIERIIAGIIDKQDQIKSLGFDIFSNRDLQQFKSIDEIIKGTVTAAKGNEKILGKIFGEEGIRAVSVLANAYRETGGFDLYDKLANADAERAGELMRDFERYSTSAAFKLQRAGEVGKKFADIALSKSIGEIGDAIAKLTDSPEKVERMTEAFSGLGKMITIVAKGLILAGEGWGLLFAMAEKEWQRSKKDNASYRQWMELPEEERKKLAERFNVNGAASYENIRGALSWHSGTVKRKHNYEAMSSLAGSLPAPNVQNKIDLTVNVDPEGRTSAVSDSLDTSINVRSNRGRIDARR